MTNYQQHVYLITDSTWQSNCGKVGKSTDIMTRLKTYGSKVIVLRVVAVPDCTVAEDHLKKTFSASFKLAKGKEYFEGDLHKMITVFDNVLNSPTVEARNDDPMIIDEVITRAMTGKA